MLRPFLRTSGPWVVRVAALGLVVAASGCYTLSPGSGFPGYIRTMAVLPFDNDTRRFELTQELHDRLLRELPRSLGVRNAGEDVADAVVRGTIRRYEVTTPLYRPGANNERAEVLQREVQISIHVEIIDQVQNVILWEDQNVLAQGPYDESSESEEIGRAEAIALLVQKIVDGAQSTW